MGSGKSCKGAIIALPRAGVEVGADAAGRTQAKLSVGRMRAVRR